MATTPPLLMISSPITPPTPLHGAAYDSPRYRTRAASKRVSQNTSLDGQSPQSTPKPRITRRIQIISPSSPDIAGFDSNPSTSTSKPSETLLSANTMMTEGMLPTPVKTPRKKAVPGVQAAARALFQDQNGEAVDRVMSPAKRSRKNRRHNGFSLESFAAQDNDEGSKVQIFTDSRDVLPEVDKTVSNPFLEQSNKAPAPTKKLPGGSKRRKISGPAIKDAQVSEAIDRDEGMVYVFRGKKVYRRFDDNDDEEEEIDAEDLGLLDQSPTKSLKTLTRKSIKPRRLFQEGKKNHQKEDEEASTDIEDDQTKETTNTETVDIPEAAPEVPQVKSAKASGSPFDSWPRLKTGTRASSRSKKRSASESA